MVIVVFIFGLSLIQWKPNLLSLGTRKMKLQNIKKSSGKFSSVAHSGCHQLLATGCIDIRNYITETPGKVDVTVTLKPAIKKVVSVPQMKRYGKR